MPERRGSLPTRTYILGPSSHPYGVVYRDPSGRRVIHVDTRVWTHGVQIPSANPFPPVTGKDRRHA